MDRGVPREDRALFAHYRALKDPRREDRIENLYELVAGVQTFSEERGSATGEGDLTAFLEEVSLLTDLDTAAVGGGVVTLMTLHNAKGLEFPVVFLAGCEENLFPLTRASSRRASTRRSGGSSTWGSPAPRTGST